MRARWSRALPSWADARAAGEPWWVASVIRLRPLLGAVVVRAFRHPVVALVAVRRGGGVRGAAAFLAALPSFEAFAVDEIVTPAGRALRLPKWRRAAPTAAAIGLHAIVQDAAETLPAALRSVADVWDEAVVIDGGSRDGTVAIAEDAGASVYVVPFADDFSAQRNGGLGRLATPWVVHIDADEVFEPELPGLLRTLAARAHVDVVFVPRLNVFHDAPEAPPFRWPDMTPRLFRRGLRFEGVVHEQLRGWRRPVYLPVNGPAIVHGKTTAAHVRNMERYHAMAPSPFTAGMLDDRPDADAGEGSR